VAGLRITMAAAARSPQLGGAALWGPMLFLAGLDVLLRADAAMRHEAPLVENDPAGPTPFERANNLNGAVAQSELIVAYEDALGAGLGAFQAVLFAWDIVMPGARLWAKVRPRLAMQRRIP
jgi:hypothetical protein